VRNQRLAQEATQQNRSYQDYLLRLLELEVAQREENQQKQRFCTQALISVSDYQLPDCCATAPCHRYWNGRLGYGVASASHRATPLGHVRTACSIPKKIGLCWGVSRLYTQWKIHTSASSKSSALSSASFSLPISL
jgi:hypothetical protein